MPRVIESLTGATAAGFRGGRGAWLPWLPAVAALPLFLSLPFLSGRVLLFRDILHFNVPEQVFAARALRSWHLPLWDPGRYGGAPFFAEPGTGVLYPLNLVFQLGDPFSAASLFVLLHLPLAAAGTLLLARALGLSRGACALAAVGFTGSGYLLSMHGGHYYLASAALLPGVTALLMRARSPRSAALAAASVALALFNGELQALAFAFVLALVLREEAGLARRLLWTSAAAILGGLLGAVQLLPTLSFARETVRAAGLGAAEAGSWALHPLRWIELLVPLPFGVAWPENGYWGAAVGAHHLPWAASLYLGPPLILPALLAARRHKRLAVLAGASLAIAAGPLLPVFALWLRLPLADRFRYPEKYALPATLALVLLGAAGVDELARAPRVRWFAAACALLSCAAAFAWAEPAWLVAAIGAGLLRAEANLTSPAALGQLVAALVHSAVLCGALAGALRLAKTRPAVLLPVFLAAALVSQGVTGARVLSWGDGSFLRHEPEVAAGARAAIPAASAGRVFNDGSCGFHGGGRGTLLERKRQWDWITCKENFCTLFGVREALGYGASEWRRQVDYVRSMDRSQRGSLPRLLGAALILGCPRGLPELRAVSDPIARVRLEGGRAAVIGDAAEQVRVAVEGGGRLVLADTFAPGWSARIDGREVPVGLDGIWRAVEVPQGAREVIFEYRAPGLAAGAVVSALALLLALALLRRRPTAAGTAPG